MTYIIDRVRLYMNGEWQNISLLVDREKILAVKPEFKQYRYMKMAARPFYMTPSYVFFLSGLPRVKSRAEYKNFFTRHFLEKGCTFLIVGLRLTRISHLSEILDAARNFLMKSPLDYTFALQVPATKLSAPLIRKTKRLKIPALLVEFNDVDELERIPWGWIREALFPYNSPLIPVPGNAKNKKDELLAAWDAIMTEEKIPHLKNTLPEQQPVPLDALKKTGIYPKKGYLHPGGELSYNFYWSKQTHGEDRDVEHVLQEKNLVITVHKGKIVRVMKKIFYRESFGEELHINRPAFFQ